MDSEPLLTPTLRLVREIGRGGMGSVWLAQHLGLGTEVVVKRMRREYLTDEEARRRFQTEATAAARLRGPHVVDVLDHGVSAAGEPYIVMERLVGRDLRAQLNETPVLPLATVATIVEQAAQALETAHGQGIVHRDVKPENLFLCGRGIDEVAVKVLDFGIAKRSVLEAAANETKTGSLLGTPFYMSPEQVVDAKRVDRRADVWALGVVAFEALTGSRPFRGETVGELAVALTHAPIPVPSERARVPRAFDGWFARACARDLGARFPTAHEAAVALRAIASGSVPEASGRPSHVVDATLPLNAHLVRTPLRAAASTAPISKAPTPAPTSSRVRVVPMVVGALVLVGGASLFVYSQLSRSGVTPATTGPTSAAAPSASAVPTPPPPDTPTVTASAPPLAPSTSASSPAPSVTATTSHGPRQTIPSAVPKPSASFDRNAIE